MLFKPYLELEAAPSKGRAGESAYTNTRRRTAPKHPVFRFKLDHKTSAKWVGVVMFLWEVYHSSAEVMPTDLQKFLRRGIQILKYVGSNTSSTLCRPFPPTLTSTL